MDERYLELRRSERWGQTLETCTPNPVAAARLIDRAGIATLFPASPEVANLLHAYTGTTTTKVTADWDSESGHVYGWRWTLGRQEVAFYTSLVRGRPTWISWELLPAVLRLRGELRALDELYDDGELSTAAYRIAQALETAGGVLSTGDLRKQAGFPTGKPQRAAYLRAIAELENHLLLAKVFSQDEEDMYHALVNLRYPQHVAVASRLERGEALEQFLLIYLRCAVYAVPHVLAKHLGLDGEELCGGLDHLVETGRVTPLRLPTQKMPCYLWKEQY
ncbi:MAG TPA: hypothetical protein VEL31_27550 [Ktedonobacteraceae bacterium]|nr:hypothetical protein [Ktedonobacteraceae bacterium]